MGVGRRWILGVVLSLALPAAAHAEFIAGERATRVGLIDGGAVWARFDQTGPWDSSVVVRSRVGRTAPVQELTLGAAASPNACSTSLIGFDAHGPHAVLLTADIVREPLTSCAVPARVLHVRGADGRWTEGARSASETYPRACEIQGAAVSSAGVLITRTTCSNEVSVEPWDGAPSVTLSLPAGLHPAPDAAPALAGNYAAIPATTDIGNTTVQRVVVFDLTTRLAIVNVAATFTGCQRAVRIDSIGADGRVLASCDTGYRPGTYATTAYATLRPPESAWVIAPFGGVGPLTGIAGTLVAARGASAFEIRDVVSGQLAATVDPRGFAPGATATSPAFSASGVPSAFDGSRLLWARDGGLELEPYPLVRPLRQPPSTTLRAPKLTAPGARAVRRLSGTAPAGTAAVYVGVARVRTASGKPTCQDVRRSGRLAKRRKTAPCTPAVALRARGTRRWSLRLRHALPRGRYVVAMHGVATGGQKSPTARRRFSVRQ